MIKDKITEDLTIIFAPIIIYREFFVKIYGEDNNNGENIKRTN